jgi:Na+/H+-translocating membrane pyrophosphatase
VLQGFGYGFFSTAMPAFCMISCVIATWQLEGHYGLVLLSASSVAGTGFQGGIASYGAIATNAHKIVHLTTYRAMTRHRANVCAALGDSTAHAGNTVSAINAFSAVFNVTLTLLAQTYTSIDTNYMMVSGSILSNFSQAGLVTGVVMTFLFCANTMLSTLETSQKFAEYCRDKKEVSRIEKLPFPQSHIKPLKILTNYGTVISMRMVFSPMINTLVCPMTGGFFLGTKGLLFLISGSNVLVLCLSIFLINSGQSWVAARKFVLFGLLKSSDGQIVGPDSVHYENLAIGESIGGPFEDATGPAMNNFIKFVAVFAFITGGPGNLYDETPENTFFLGFIAVASSISLVFFSKRGLTQLLKLIEYLMKRRQRQIAFEEGDLPEEEEEEEKEDDYFETL